MPASERVPPWRERPRPEQHREDRDDGQRRDRDRRKRARHCQRERILSAAGRVCDRRAAVPRPSSLSVERPGSAASSIDGVLAHPFEDAMRACRRRREGRTRDRRVAIADEGREQRRLRQRQLGRRRARNSRCDAASTPRKPNRIPPRSASVLRNSAFVHDRVSQIVVENRPRPSRNDGFRFASRICTPERYSTP